MKFRQFKSSAARRIVLLASGLMFFYGVFLGGLQCVISLVAANFGANAGGMGLLVSAQFLTAVAAPIPAGALADKIGRKPVLMASAFTFGLGCLIAGSAQVAAVYIGGALLVGAGYSVCESGCCAILSDVDPENAARWITFTQALLCIGAVLSPIATRLAMDHFNASWRLVFYTCAAAFILLGLMLSFISFPSSTPTPHLRPTKQRNGSGLFISAPFIILFVSILLYVGLESGFGYFVESLFSTEIQQGAAGSLAVSLYWAGMAASRLLFSVRSLNHRRLLILCFGASCLMFALLALLRSSFTALIVCALAGMSCGPIWSTLMAESARRFPQNAGSATGIMSAGCGLGGILYPSLMGMIAVHFGLRGAFALLALTGLVGLLLCLRLSETPAD